MSFSLNIARSASLALVLALGGGVLTGCSDEAVQAQALAPVEIDRATSCELDGMLLIDYAGPKAQIHYAGQEKPSFFCDTVELFNTLLAGEQVRAVRMVYVQDMGKADWEHPEGHWIDAKTAIYVVGSKRHGSMVPPLPVLRRKRMRKNLLANMVALFIPTTASSWTWSI